MPIYEYYCPDCHVIFNFLSRRIDPSARPGCPRCGRRKLGREVSLFAAVKRGRGGEGEGEGGEGGGMDDLPIDDARIESAVGDLASEAERIGDDDPRAAARLMRKFASATGMEFGDSMETALSRMEAGEDPDAIEEDLGEAIEGEEPFVIGGRKGGRGGRRRGARRGAPGRDPKLYEL